MEDFDEIHLTLKISRNMRHRKLANVNWNVNMDINQWEHYLSKINHFDFSLIFERKKSDYIIKLISHRPEQEKDLEKDTQPHIFLREGLGF